MTNTYVNQLLLELATGNARENSYRPALKALFVAIDPSIKAVNEPSRSEHGAPDFAFYKGTNGNLALGYVETKDLTVDLDQIEKTEQLERYLGYANLILTNYLEFRFFRNGVKYQTITIAKPSHSVITPLEENYAILEREIKAFLEGRPETITNAVRLAEIMGGKAARVRDNVISYLNVDHEKNEGLLRIYKVMQELLVHDLTIEQFADMYAQTLVYGLFVARYYDETPETFTRSEARDLIPASNPFLQQFFDHIAGANFDRRLTYIVDELCDVFSVSAVHEIIAKHYNLFGEVVDKDPIIHFYEDFLKEYDPALRKKMGAYYTPVVVVNFIIRAVDDILKNDFNLSQGLADITRIERQIMQQGTKAKESLHKVQILDPAVGTATFLNETVKFIYEKFKGQEGVWESYVERELLPRLYGFELMMAPYTIAHLKLAMTLKETGIDHFDRRLGVYLTNTLEEGISAQQTLFGPGFGESIAEESREAAEIKSNRPIMVIIGNPPYSVSSSNKGEWITNLIKDYKIGLNERNIQPLSDDYIKFIRLAEYFIEKNGSGIVAMITNNSFLDGVIHRKMRKHLLQTFEDIYILDLHGNSKKKETAPDGSNDENIFDIQQGVSISIMVRNEKKKEKLGTVHHAELYGRRESKFDFLNGNKPNCITWKILNYAEPYYFFTPKDFVLIKEYEKGFRVDDLFIIGGSGIKTNNDSFLISITERELDKKLEIFRAEIPSSEINNTLNLTNGKYWNTEREQKKVIDNQNPNYKKYDYLYRPFDIRKIYYQPNLIQIGRGGASEKVMQNLYKNNVALITKRGIPYNDLAFLTPTLSDMRTWSNPGTQGTESVFPLYLYDDDGSKYANLKKEIVDDIEKIIGKVSTEDIFDYVYAVLHSSSYRQRYKEFLKIDFPRIPYPKDEKTFRFLVELGNKLRKIHLMEDPELENLITTYSVQGDNLVEKVEYKGGNVWINDTQYFGNVPKEAWEFYIGGYQPAQKWLKDRKGRKLTYEDIIHYQKIVIVLMKTQQIMQEIDRIISF
jgi:type I restriction-modification system DNA methylase subunit